MRTLISTGLLFLVLFAPARHPSISLQSALDKKLVKAGVNSLGGYQGYCMSVVLKNLGKDSLIVLIEPGRRLNSVDDKYQDILVVKQEIIALRGGEEKTTKVKGYCCQAFNRSPSKGIRYDINKLADSSLVMLARYLDRSAFDGHVEQKAIWAISNNHSTAEVTARHDSVAVPLRRLVAALKGEPLPWYTVVSHTYAYPNGVIIVTPLLLQGTLDYTLSSDSYITLRIMNEKGEPVCLTRSEWRTGSQKGNYDLDLPVKGLAKGKYTVELRAEGKELVKKEFEL